MEPAFPARAIDTEAPPASPEYWVASGGGFHYRKVGGATVPPNYAFSIYLRSTYGVINLSRERLMDGQHIYVGVGGTHTHDLPLRRSKPFVG